MRKITGQFIPISLYQHDRVLYATTRTSLALAAVLRSTAQSDSDSIVVSNKVVFAGFVLSNRKLSLTDANFHNHVFAHYNF